MVCAQVTTRDEWIPDRRRRLGDERWGYGYMWWVWDAPKDSGAMAGVCTARDIMDGAYTARRLGGQFITVLPQFDMVIAHKTDSRYGGDASNRRKRVSAQEYATAVRMVIAARCDVSGCR